METLIRAVQQGDSELIRQISQSFLNNVDQLTEIAHHACLLSRETDDIEQVHMLINKIKDHSRKIIRIVQTFIGCIPPKQAIDFLHSSHNQWLDDIHTLTKMIDEITTMEDFLAVVENNTLEDIDRCIQAINDRNSSEFISASEAIERRSTRIIEIMIDDQFQSKQYIDQLRDRILPAFINQTKTAILLLESKDLLDCREFEMVEDDFLQTASHIYHTFRDIRNSLSMNSVQSNSDTLTTIHSVSQSSMTNGALESKNQKNITNTSDCDEITQNLSSVVDLQSKPTEIITPLNWNDLRSEMMNLARRIAITVMEMTDFTRGRGKLKSPADVIDGAKQVSHCGFQLAQLTKEISDQCLESQTKTDLQIYIDRLFLYCHQLDFTRRIKFNCQQQSTNENYQDVSFDSFPSDNLSSLINTAANLINAVVLTVQAAYIASIQARAKPPSVCWNRILPERQTCSSFERSNSIDSESGLSTEKTRFELLRVLSQFTELQQNTIDFQ